MDRLKCQLAGTLLGIIGVGWSVLLLGCAEVTAAFMLLTGTI